MPPCSKKSLRALDRELVAFEAVRPALERRHMGKFVVFCDAALRGVFDTPGKAAAFAREEFRARRRYLIHQVGMEFGLRPASEMHSPIQAAWEPANGGDVDPFI